MQITDDDDDADAVIVVFVAIAACNGSVVIILRVCVLLCVR